jgi:AcrR family transcriptional regulator
VGRSKQLLDYGVESLVDDADLTERRRGAILDAAADLFARRGYHETTIKDIARSMGVSSGLVYSYMKTKEDVLFLIIARALDGYCADMTSAIKGASQPVNRFKLAFRAYCRGVIRNSNQTLLAFRHVVSLPKERRDMLKSLDDKSTVILANEIEACITAGHFRRTGPPQVLAAMAAHLAQAWPLKMWNFSRYLNEDEFVEEAIEMVLGSLAASPTARGSGGT